MCLTELVAEQSLQITLYVYGPDTETSCPLLAPQFTSMCKTSNPSAVSNCTILELLLISTETVRANRL